MYNLEAKKFKLKIKFSTKEADAKQFTSIGELVKYISSKYDVDFDYANKPENTPYLVWVREKLVEQWNKFEDAYILKVLKFTHEKIYIRNGTHIDAITALAERKTIDSIKASKGANKYERR